MQIVPDIYTPGGLTAISVSRLGDSAALSLLVMLPTSSLEYWSPEIIFFLFKTGNSLLDATVRPFVSTAVCRELFSDQLDQCSDPFLHKDDQVIQQRTAAYLTYYRVLMYVPSCVLGIFWGAWCDKEGCKLPMILPNVGCVLGILSYILIDHYPEYTMILFLAGTAFQGFLCAASIVKMSINAYVAKNTSPEGLSRRLSVISGMSNLGLMAGYLLVGILLDMTNAQVAFCMASLIHTVCIFLILLMIKDNETITTDDPVPFLRMCFSGCYDTVASISRKREGNSRCIIHLLCACVFLQGMIIVGYSDIPLLYVQGKPLLWPQSWYGYFSAAEQTVRVFGLFVVQPFISGRLLVSDTAVVQLSLVFGLLRAVWCAFCVKSWMMWISVLMAVMSGLTTPFLRLLLKKQASVEEVGKIFSFVESIDIISRPIASAIFIATYSGTYTSFPGAVYLVHAAVHVIFIALVMCIMKS